MTDTKKDFDHIFRAYDIRGVFGEDLTEEVATKIGAAFGKLLEGKKFVVGRDVRISGEKLRDALLSGILNFSDVTDVGVLPTPLLYFALIILKKDAGIMVTASHNPPQWNGFKAFRGQKGSIYGEDMEKVKNYAKQFSIKSFGNPKCKAIKHDGIIKEYQKFVQSKISMEKKIKAVADTSNGTCGLVAPELFKKIGVNILTLNKEPDGTFPAHLPVPKAETLGELMKQVVNSKADFGVGYDGDGDRAVFIDEKGNLIPGDLTLLLFAKDILQKQKGGKVVYELTCSMAIKEYVEQLGGIPIVERVGHTFIMDKMIKENAVLGGEKSSHFYFADVYGMDDGVFASMKLAEILSKTDNTLSELVSALPQYPSIYEKNFDCPDTKKFSVIEKVRSQFKALGLETLDIDGVKLIQKDGWVILRASNTEPVIRISAEAHTEEKLNELYDLAVKELKKALKGD
ncbi:MAG: phosphomannomutase/phosphoglucomutase [Candidatus Bathyarchaeum tardum]|nr:MAG: phosphomannomutase/phosphoglucomutase [Candidatus Bathyarchaeum tardum]